MYYSLAKQGGRLVDIKSFCCPASLMCPMTTPLVHLCAGSSPRPLLREWRSCESEPCFPRTTIQNALDPSPFPWRAKHVHSEVRGGIPKWITKLWKALPLEDCLTELLAPFPLDSKCGLSDLPTLRSSPGALSVAVSDTKEALAAKNEPTCLYTVHAVTTDVARLMNEQVFALLLW